MTGQLIKPLVVSVSKEDVPDKDIIEIDQDILDDGLRIFENNVERVAGIISGEIEPKKCGRCDYCRSQKKLDTIIRLSDLIGG